MSQPPRFLIAVLALFSSVGPAAEQIFLPALPALQADFGVSVPVAQLSLSLSLLAMAAAPLAFGPWSDRVGRRLLAIWGLVLLIGGSPDAAGTASGIAGSLQLAVGAAISQLVGTGIGTTPYPMAVAMVSTSTLALLVIALRRAIASAPATQ